MIESPYRLLSEPVCDDVEGILEKHPDTFVHVSMGHLAMDTYWEQFLHQNSAYIFNLALSRLDRVVVTQVSCQVHHKRQ